MTRQPITDEAAGMGGGGQSGEWGWLIFGAGMFLWGFIVLLCTRRASRRRASIAKLTESGELE